MELVLPRAEIKDLKEQCISLESQLEDLSAEKNRLARSLLLLCQATQGFDLELDARLRAMKTALRSPSGDDALSDSIQLLEKGMFGLLGRRDDSVQQSQEAFFALASQLEIIELDEDSQGRLDNFRKKVSADVEIFSNYAGLLKELSRIQSAVIDIVQSRRLTAAASTGQDGEDDLAQVCERICGLLLAFLDKLTVPAEALARVRFLRKRLEGGLTYQTLESILDDAFKLALSSATDEYRDFESYLKKLNVQLDDIQQLIGDGRSDAQASRECKEWLDHSIRNDVSKMATSLEGEKGIEQLKTGVRAQLKSIVGVVERFREEEQEREELQEKRFQQLQEKIDTMEKQAESVQSHLEEQRQRALLDPLTSLPNRGAYDDRIDQEFVRWRRYGGSLTLMVCDLDLFKRINDTFGHLAGDKVLRLVAQQMANSLRATDFLARYGGEEFVILMPQVSPAQGLLVVEKLRKKIETSPFNFKGEPVNVTLSFGIASFFEGDKPEAVFARADAALYQAKKAGRNRCVVADE